MTEQAKHYETQGDKLKGEKAVRAYRAAQNHLSPQSPAYGDNLKRLQGKIIKTLEQAPEVQFLVRLPAGDHDWLKIESQNTGLSMAEIMRQGLDLYKTKKEEK